MAKQPLKNLTNLIDDAPLPGLEPTAGAAKTTPKGKVLLTYNIDDDLKPMLDRVVFWEGKRGSQRVVVNAALRAFFANHPNAQREIPGE